MSWVPLKQKNKKAKYLPSKEQRDIATHMLSGVHSITLYGYFKGFLLRGMPFLHTLWKTKYSCI